MAAPSDLVTALSQELAAGREFEALLESEAEALLRQAADALPALSARKSELARHIASLERARNDALARQGLPRGKKGFEDACAKLGAEARRTFDELVRCARRVRDLSLRNEILVNMRLQHVAMALSILRRSDLEPQVYAADGRARSGGSRLARAIA